MTAGDPVLEALTNPEDAPHFADAGDPGPELSDGHGGSRHERPPFKRGGPVKCLGIQSDMSGSIKCYYLDSLGQIVGLDANNRHGKNAMIALYGQQSDFLEANWSQWSKPRKERDPQTKEWVEVEKSVIIGFDQAEVSRAHIEECVRKGIFDPTGKLRGRGAHRTDAGNLLLHLGDVLLIPNERANGSMSGYKFADPDTHGGYVYPASAKSMRPYHEEVGPEAGQKILAQLSTWSYKRPLLDPMLLLGAIAASMLGGFLAWRPTIWTVGPRGSGKSTLDGEPSANEGFIGHLIGPARLSSSDTSAAAIRQTLKNATIPVFIDELEPNAPKEKIDATVALARVSAGGSKGHRGGQDQQAHEFTLRSPFWFSSILQPPFDNSADSSRIVTIELKPLTGSPVKPDFFKMNAAEMGAKLFRRVVDQAQRLDQTIALYSAALSKRGLDSRAQSVYGTLLGCADIALYDEMPDDELVNEWALRLDPARLIENAAATSDEQGCLDHLLTSPVQARGGDEREALSTWIGKAMVDLLKGEDELPARRIQQMGLKLVHAKLLDLVDGPDGDKVPRWGATAFAGYAPGFLAIAWKHRGLDPLFADTKWRGGVWRQQLARIAIDYAAEEAKDDLPASEAGQLAAIDGVKVKFDRLAANAVLVPLSAFVDAEDLPKASTPRATNEWIAKQINDAAAAAVKAGKK